VPVLGSFSTDVQIICFYWCQTGEQYFWLLFFTLWLGRSGDSNARIWIILEGRSGNVSHVAVHHCRDPYAIS
jgi:hypothetical protein